MVRAGGPPRMGGACRHPRTCKGPFALITQALNLDDMGPEERKATQAAAPGLLVGLRALAGCAKDMAMGNLAGRRHMAGAEVLAPGPLYARPGSAV